MSTPESQFTGSIGDFAKRVREKYPRDYDDVPDEVLVDRIVAKYPDYKTSVKLPDFDAPVTNEWGARRSYGGHTGVDVGYGKGEQIAPPLPGRVVFAGERSGYGNRVEIDHGHGITTSYSHLDGFDVKEGDDITPDRPLGRVGNSGGNYRPHLHFEVLRDGQKVNAADTPYRPRRFSSASALPVPGVPSPSAPPASPPAPPVSTGYLDETQERPEDFAPAPRVAPSLYTQTGRAERDLKIQAERQGGAQYRIPVGAGATPEAIKEAVSFIARETDTSPAFVERWLRENTQDVGLFDAEGKPLTSSPTGFATIPTELIGKLRADYRKYIAERQGSFGVLRRDVSEAIRTHSPGELLVGAAESVVRGTLRALDLGTRPLQAGSAAFWAKVKGADDVTALKTAFQEFMGEQPELGKNLLAEIVRSGKLPMGPEDLVLMATGGKPRMVDIKAVNPRLPALLGFFTEMIADPANLIPGGLVAKGGKMLGRAGKAGGRLAKVAEGMRDLGVYEPDIPDEAFKALDDTRTLGDLTRRADAVNVPDVPVGTIPAPRLVRRAESPSVETGASEAVPAQEPSVAGQSAQPVPTTETIIRHSDPRIDGGKVIGQTADGKLKVENNEGGVSLVKHPRKGGNREAALVRREVVDAGIPTSGERRLEDVAGVATEQLPGTQRPHLVEASPSPVGTVAEARPTRPGDAATADASAPPRVATPPDRLDAPVPGPRAFRAQMKKHFRLSDEQADAVHDLTEARAKAWAKENGKDASDYYVERFGGIVRGGEASPSALNQTAWHGSPYEFDRFDASKIGTGEGAQSFGHGLYFTDSREIGQFYKDKLSKMPPAQSLTDAMREVRVGQRAATDFNVATHPELVEAAKKGDAAEAVRFAEAQAVRWDDYVASPDYPFKDYAREQAEAMRAFATATKKEGIRYGDRRGALYKVDLAPEESDYLLWDKPLSEQSDKVKAALRKAGYDVPDRKNLTDRQVVDLGRRFLTSNRAQALWREDIGIRDSMRPAVRAFEAGEAEFVKFARSLEGQKFFDRYIHKTAAKNPTGEMFYRELQFAEPDLRSQKPAGQAAASEKLRALGVRGIKYLAGDSRAVGEGSHNYVIFDDADVTIKEVLRQRNKAAVEFLDDSRAVIRAFERADVSSAVHELGHVFRRDLSPALLKDAEDAIGVKNGKWTPPDEEKFARGFERYLKTGNAPTEKLRTVYAQFKTWLTEIYGAIRGKKHELSFKPNPELIAVFDRMLGGQPKGEFGQLTYALHKAPDAGTPAFFENAQVKRALGLKPDASTEDVRWALASAVGEPRASHVTPEDVKKWADSKQLGNEARKALEFAAGKYGETVKAPSFYEQTGIRKSHLDTQVHSLSEAVRRSGGIRLDVDGANRGELARLSKKEAGTTGIVRKDGAHTAEEMAEHMRELGYPASDNPNEFLSQLEADLRGEKIYSSEREVDYEELYRQANPDDSADALISLIETERGGILFDKVQDGTATRREIQEFKQLAADGGVYPEHVRSILGSAKEAQASTRLQDSAGRKPEEDFDFRDDSVGDEEPAWLYQSGRPEQLGFTQDELVPQTAPRSRELAAYDKSQLRDEPLRRALGDDTFVRLRGLQESPVARIASEIEKRVTPQNAQNAPDLVAALSKLAELKRTKQTVDDYLNQGSLFGGRELTPAQERILSALDKNPRKVVEDAFPADAKPQQDVLFQSAGVGDRRQRAYRALLEAKGQGSLVPDLAPEPIPGRDTDLREFFRTPLSNLDFKGTYERLGGEPGKKISDAFRDAQFKTDERLNELRKTTKPERLEEAEKAIRHEELDRLRATLRPLVKKLRDGGKPDLADDVLTHLNALSGAPTKFEKAVGNLIRETPGLGKVVKNPDLAMRHAAARLTSLQATLKLKYNIRSSIVNLTDPLTTLWPYASTADMAAVYADFLKPSTRKMLKDRGVTGGVTKLDEAGLVRTRQGLGDKLSPFRKASEVNRSVAYLYGLKEAKRAGLEGEKAHRLALDWAKKVEFDNSVWNAPPVLRTSGGKVLGQFKGYAVKSFENLANVVRSKETDKTFTRAARVSKFVVGKGAVGGVRAGGVVTKWGGRYMAGMLAYQLMQKGYSKEEAEQAADAVYMGAPALIGLDLSGSVMMFEPPFGQTLTEQAVNFVGGPTVGTALKVGQGIKDAYSAEDGKRKSREEKLKTVGERTANALTPYYKMGKSAVQTAQGRPTQKLNDKEVPVTTYEGTMKALGFTLKNQTKFYDERDFAVPKPGGTKGGITVPPPPKKGARKGGGAY